MNVAAVLWMFVAVVTFESGNTANWPASFGSKEECEMFRENLPDWFDEHADEYGIVYATWDKECYVMEDPHPLPESDQHSH